MAVLPIYEGRRSKEGALEESIVKCLDLLKHRNLFKAISWSSHQMDQQMRTTGTFISRASTTLGFIQNKNHNRSAITLLRHQSVFTREDKGGICPRKRTYSNIALLYQHLHYLNYYHIQDTRTRAQRQPQIDSVGIYYEIILINYINGITRDNGQ